MSDLLLNLLKFFNPETSHSLSLSLLKIAHKLHLYSLLGIKFNFKNQDSLVFKNLTFKNRLGTAAGLDKNADYIECLGALGFGFLEVGTVTPRPQIGNPKPRVFRFTKHNSVINRLGFNNKGLEHLVNNLKRSEYDGVLGVNIGANKDSNEEQRIKDYLICFRGVAEYADYITINISSPNTPGLRDLHSNNNIAELLNEISLEREKLNYKNPIFLKISPDEDQNTYQNIINAVIEYNLDGLIATNTTIQRDQSRSSSITDTQGGLSGRLLYDKSNEVLKQIADHSKQNLLIIGVGGVDSRDSFYNKLKLGSSLVQVYTGFIFRGPKLIKAILE